MPPKWQQICPETPPKCPVALPAGMWSNAGRRAAGRRAPGIAFCAMFVLGGLSDGADGYLARKYDLCSVFGAELDGQADTCFYAAMVVVSLRWYAVELRHQVPLIVAADMVAPIVVGGGLRKVRGGLLLHSVTGKLWG